MTQVHERLSNRSTLREVARLQGESSRRKEQKIVKNWARRILALTLMAGEISFKDIIVKDGENTFVVWGGRDEPWGDWEDYIGDDGKFINRTTVGINFYPKDTETPATEYEQGCIVFSSQVKTDGKENLETVKALEAEARRTATTPNLIDISIESYGDTQDDPIMAGGHGLSQTYNANLEFPHRQLKCSIYANKKAYPNGTYPIEAHASSSLDNVFPGMIEISKDYKQGPFIPHAVNDPKLRDHIERAISLTERLMKSAMHQPQSTK